jgi:hypothetical protein
MDKRVIFYFIPNNYTNDMNDKNDIKIYNTYANSIHLGNFIYNLNNLYLNDLSPFDNNYDDMWFDLGIASEKNINCVISISFDNIFDGNHNNNNNYHLFYKTLCELLIDKKEIIKGIDMDVENKISLDNINMFINDIKRDFPNLLLVISSIGYSMCVMDINTIYENEKEWSYILFNNSPEGQMIDYYCCNFNEDNLTLDSFQDIIDNGFLPNKIVLGCFSMYFKDYDNYFELNSIRHKYPNIGGTFIKYYDDIPYNWDLNVWLCINSK